MGMNYMMHPEKDIRNIKLTDFEHKHPMATVFGELTTAERNDRINVQFQYGISSKDTKQLTSGTGVVSHAGSARAQVSSGTGVGYSHLESLDAIRYIPGHEMVCNFTAHFVNQEAGVDQFIGLMDDENGIAVGYKGTDYGILFRAGSVDTFIPHSNFNALNQSIDPSGFHIYKISFGWLGIAPMIVSIFAGWQVGWIPLHVIDHTGENVPHLLNPVLPIRAYVERTSGSGADVQLRTASWRAGIVGPTPYDTSLNRVYQVAIKNKAITGNSSYPENPLLSIRNVTSFASLTNHVRCRLATFAINADGNQSVFINIFRNATLTGASFYDVETGESVCQYDTSATAVTGGELIAGTTISKNGSLRINLMDMDTPVIFRPGDSITVTANSASGNDVSLYVRHVEEF